MIWPTRNRPFASDCTWPVRDAVMMVTGENATMTQMLQVEAGSRVTALSEDICARTALRQATAHPT
jgi:hypothetical protein